MAYATSNPPNLIAQRVGANGGALWVYKDADDLNTVTGLNYVTDAADLGLKAGDRVIYIDSTYEVSHDLTAVSGPTTGTASGAAAGAVEPIGETSIALASAGTGTILVGDIINFEGDSTDYEVTTGDTDVSDGGTLVITPGLAVATYANQPITVKSNVINLEVAGAGAGAVTLDDATYSPSASESGTLFLLARAAGVTVTLPAPVVGVKYRFLVTTSVTSNDYGIDTDGASTFFVGNVNQIIAASATSEGQVADGATHVSMNQNGTTTGGLAGSYWELEAISSTLWMVNGILVSSGTLATPFAT